MDKDKVEHKIEKKRMKRTKLTWDKYMKYLIEAIDESNFMKRSEIKPMATPKDNLETHLTSRATHVRNAANISKRIAQSLKLNSDYVYAGMLMHDAGHPFSGHDGEDMFTAIGEIYNCQYFHHNAKGVEVVKSENVCERAISKIPNIKNNPQLREKLEKEFPYFLDIIISHDGEASPDEIYRKETKYPSIAEAVKQKLKSANSTNKYKFVAQTTEGKIAKFADVIAYLATDMRDGFRLGIYKDFPDEYLELFGEMFAEQYVETAEEKRAIARNIIDNIKEEKVRQLVQDAKEEENIEIIKIAGMISKQINQEISKHQEKENKKSFEEHEEVINDIISKKIEEYKNDKGYEYLSEEEKKYVDSDVQKIKEFVGKKMRVRSTVVAEVTTRMQEYFINDLLKNSHNSDQLRFSENGLNLFFKAKKLNYRTYVPKTKWDYQKEAQPKAALKLVQTCAKSLIKSGAITHKFYDSSVRKYITDEEALKCLKANNGDEEQYENYKKEHNIRDIKETHKKYTGNPSGIVAAKRELFSNIYQYVQNEGKTFATRYMNTYYAIEKQIEYKVDCVLGNISEKEVDDKETDLKPLKDRLVIERNTLKKSLEKQYGSIENITKEQRDEIVNKLVKKERKKMAEKMAIQYSIDYLSGMTDRGFNELAIRTGYMRKKDFNGERVDEETASKDKKLNNLANSSELPKDKGER